MRKLVPWLSGAALLAVAGALTLAIPSDDALTEPFPVRGTVGEEIASRTLLVTVEDAAFADRLAVSDAEWTADGNWLVVPIEASASRSETAATIGLATLTIDGTTFQASERPSASLLQARLHVGTPLIGDLAFELPADLRSGTAALRLSPTSTTPLLDDVITLSLTLDGLPRVPEHELEPPTWATP